MNECVQSIGGKNTDLGKSVPAPLIGRFYEKLREASISFMSVRLSFRTEQLGSHGMNFLLNLIFEYFFRKPAEIIPIVIKS